MLAVRKWVLIACAVALSLISILAGVTIGCYFGVKSGVKIEAGNNAVIGAQEAIKSQSIKEKNDNATRNLSHAAVDSGLDSNGWMRTD